MLHSSFDSILEARDPLDYEATVVGFAKQLGFDLVTAVAVVDRANGTAQFFNVGNTPDAFINVAADPSKGRIDPVMQHCKHRSAPIIWDRQTYMSAGQIDLWEEQAPFGGVAGSR